jgi:hypothetical protein
VYEITRLAPTIPLITKTSTQDTELLGHYIPKGTLVAASGIVAASRENVSRKETNSRPDSESKKGYQRSVGWWDGNDKSTELFNPARWLDEEGNFDKYKGPVMLFGLGNRSCFGKNLAVSTTRLKEIRTLSLIVLGSIK